MFLKKGQVELRSLVLPAELIFAAILLLFFVAQGVKFAHGLNLNAEYLAHDLALDADTLASLVAQRGVLNSRESVTSYKLYLQGHEVRVEKIHSAEESTASLALPQGSTLYSAVQAPTRIAFLKYGSAFKVQATAESLSLAQADEKSVRSGLQVYSSPAAVAYTAGGS